MKVWENDADFLTELKADAEVTSQMPVEELTAMFDIGYHTKNIDLIFERVFDEG